MVSAINLIKQASQFLFLDEDRFAQRAFPSGHVLMRANIFPPLPTINAKVLMTHLSCSFLSVGRGHVQPSQTTECRLHRGSEGRRVRLLHLQRRGLDPHGRPKPVPLLRPAETLCHRHGQVWLQVSGTSAEQRDDAFILHIICKLLQKLHLSLYEIYE